MFGCLVAFAVSLTASGAPVAAPAGPVAGPPGAAFYVPPPLPPRRHGAS